MLNKVQTSNDFYSPIKVKQELAVVRRELSIHSYTSPAMSADPYKNVSKNSGSDQNTSATTKASSSRGNTSCELFKNDRE